MGRFDKNNLSRGINYFKRNGVKKSLYKALERLDRDSDEVNYSQSVIDSRPSPEELKNQSLRDFKESYKISILIPAYETDDKLLRETLNSVAAQSYGNWELCIADASKTDRLRNVVNDFEREWSHRCSDKYGNIHEKVKYLHLAENKGISGNTNVALDMATGEYIALLDHDDLLEPDALYEFMIAIENKHKGDKVKNLSKVLVAYSDEDKVDFNNTRYFDHHIKPDYDHMLLCTNNYICHLLFVDTNLARSVEGFHSKYDGAQDHDFVLRCTEGISKDKIIHIPKALYHWRSTPSSTAENPNAKLYAYKAGKEAVKDHLCRIGINAEVKDTSHLGFFEINFEDASPDVKTISQLELYNQSNEELMAGYEDYILIIGKNIKAVDEKAYGYMINTIVLNDVGAVTGKIISANGRVESAGYDKMPDGSMKPRFAGLNRNYSGYLHRADLQLSVEGFSDELVLLKKDAVLSYRPKIVLREGNSIIYEPRAVFMRRNV